MTKKDFLLITDSIFESAVTMLQLEVDKRAGLLNKRKFELDFAGEAKRIEHAHVHMIRAFSQSLRYTADGFDPTKFVSDALYLLKQKCNEVKQAYQTRQREEDAIAGRIETICELSIDPSIDGNINEEIINLGLATDVVNPAPDQ